MTINLPTGKNLPEIEYDQFQKTVKNVENYIEKNNIKSYARTSLRLAF